jgi:hypothetical protein
MQYVSICLTDHTSHLLFPYYVIESTNPELNTFFFQGIYVFYYRTGYASFLGTTIYRHFTVKDLNFLILMFSFISYE